MTSRDKFPERVVLGVGWPMHFADACLSNMPGVLWQDDCPLYNLVLERVGDEQAAVRDWLKAANAELDRQEVCHADV